jgi:hypothetical protein
MKIKLRKKGIHKKLQNYTFRDAKLLYNFCPYWWLTIFCIIIFPLTLIYRTIESFIDYLNKKLESRYLDFIENNLTIDDILNIYYGIDPKSVKMKLPFRFKRFHSYQIWTDWRDIKRSKLSPKDWNDIWDFISNYRLLSIKPEPIKKVKVDILSPKNLNRIIKATKIFTYSILALILLITIFYTIELIIFNFRNFLEIMKGTFLVIIICLLLASPIFLTIYLITDFIPEHGDKILNSRFIKWIESTFSFFWDYFISLKNNYCPEIEWIDDES